MPIEFLNFRNASRDGARALIKRFMDSPFVICPQKAVHTL